MISIEKLNINSPKKDNPKFSKIPLWTHQKTMLYKCLDIEKSNKEKYGVLADKPGTGKTFVVLSIILSNLPSCNIIVVPQNIYSQWSNSIQKFCDLENVSYKQFTNYSEISNLYSQKDNLKDVNIILTNYLYYHIISGIINGLGIRINRVFFDEIDSINDMLKEPIKCNFTWFVSASFQKDKLGCYKSLVTSIDDKICICSDDLIEKSIVLESPLEHKLQCYNLLIELVKDILPKDKIAELNALDYNTNIYKYTSKIPKDEKEFLKYLLWDMKEILAYHSNNISSLLNTKKEVETCGFYEGEILQQKIESIKKQIQCSQYIINGTSNLRSQLYEKLKKSKICPITLNSLENTSKYISKCCSVYYDKDSINSEINCCICNKTIKYPDGFLEERIMLKRNTRNKEEYKIDVFKKLTCELNNLNNKTIIFSDYPFIFKEIEDYFKKNNMSFTTLDSGNREALDKSINEYKNGSSSFLLVDSSLNGCGMNLENTDNIVFIHKTKSELERQVIGRCQRPGRKTRLNIYRLLHKNELD